MITLNPVDTILASAGQSATLSCSATGEPPPMYTWTRNGVPVFQSSNVAIETTLSGSNLVLLSVQSQHVGTYSCIAMNSESTVVSGNATLEIAGKFA